MVGYISGFFSYVDRYIYLQIFPYIYQENLTHKNFTLIDASRLNNSDLNKLILKISSKNPKLIIADVFHKNNINIDNKISNIKSNIIFSFPISNINNKIKYFDIYIKSYDNLKNKNIFLYDLTNIYTNEFISKDTLKSLSKLKYLPKDYYFNIASINYNNNPSFSKIYASNILKDNSLVTFIKDKIILISNIDNNYVHSDFNKEFFGTFVHQEHLAFLLKSSIYSEWLYDFYNWQYFLFFIFLIISIIIISTILSQIYMPIMFVLGILLPTISYWIMLSLYNFLMPISEMTTISLLTTMLLLSHWREVRDRRENIMLTQMNRRLHDRNNNKTFYNSDKHWEEIIKFIDQLLTIKKSILFEKVPNDKRIKEVSSLNCSFDEIIELRRDYTREPYKSAIKYNTISIPKRPFFSTKTEEQEEFIVPLSYQNEIVGFWALMFDKQALSKIDNYNMIIDNLAKEIAHILVSRSKFKTQTTKKNVIKNIFNMEAKDDNLAIFKKNLGFLEKKMVLNDIVFDSISSNIVTYNLFGKIIHINGVMDRLFVKEGINAYNFNASTMLEKMTDIPPAKTKRLIREVIINHKEHIQFVTCNKTKKKFLFMASPLTQKDIDNKIKDTYLFNTYGILFVFIDFNFIEKNSYLRQNVMEVSLENRKNRLDNLKNNISLLDNTINSDTNQKRLISALKDKISDMNSALEYIKSLMTQSLDNVTDDLYPIKIQDNINTTSDYIKDKYKNKEISFNIKAPDKLPLITASINSIDKTLNSIFDFLALDTHSTKSIDIEIMEKDGYVEVNIDNNGYGMPLDELVNDIKTNNSQASYIDLRYAIKNIKNAEGKITFDTSLGQGIKTKIQFKTILL